LNKIPTPKGGDAIEVGGGLEKEKKRGKKPEGSERGHVKGVFVDARTPGGGNRKLGRVRKTGAFRGGKKGGCLEGKRVGNKRKKTRGDGGWEGVSREAGRAARGWLVW